MNHPFNNALPLSSSSELLCIFEPVPFNTVSVMAIANSSTRIDKVVPRTYVKIAPVAPLFG
jgi:hypothetical protein